MNTAVAIPMTNAAETAMVKAVYVPTICTHGAGADAAAICFVWGEKSAPAPAPCAEHLKTGVN